MPIRGSIANSLKSFGADRTGGIPKTATPVVDYIMVAGGGGGGFSGGGGGGGGGFITGSGYPVGSGITLTFGIGGGGGGGNPGGSSSITGPGTPTVSASGGGDGGDGPSGANLGGSGGSGGGGARDNSSQPTNRGAGTPGQGNNGGNGASPPQGAAGGGGGIGGGGQNGQPNPGQPYDIGRNGGDGRGIHDVWGGFGYSYLNPAISPGSGPWTSFNMGCGGGNGIQRDGSQQAGFGGSNSSIPGLYPRTGGDGGGGPGSAKSANSATQYTGSGGGGGPPNPGNGASPSGGSGSGGSIIVRFDEFYSNAVSTTGGPLYSYQNGYHNFHFIGSGSITF